MENEHTKTEEEIAESIELGNGITLSVEDIDNNTTLNVHKKLNIKKTDSQGDNISFSANITSNDVSNIIEFLFENNKNIKELENEDLKNRIEEEREELDKLWDDKITTIKERIHPPKEQIGSILEMDEELKKNVDVVMVDSPIFNIDDHGNVISESEGGIQKNMGEISVKRLVKYLKKFNAKKLYILNEDGIELNNNYYTIQFAIFN